MSRPTFGLLLDCHMLRLAEYEHREAEAIRDDRETAFIKRIQSDCARAIGKIRSHLNDGYRLDQEIPEGLLD